jgi:hypothetical protein
MKEPRGLSGVLLLLLIQIVHAQDYDLTWHTIDGGGGTSAGGGYTLTGTVAQPDASAAEALTGGTFSLTGGFWAGTFPACTSFAPPDFDHDCDVDVDDYTAFLGCVTGPSVAYNPLALPSGCTFTPDAQSHVAPDFDGDNDVDQDDFGVLQKCYSGSSIPAAANCAG